MSDLRRLFALGVISALDYHFAGALEHVCPGQSDQTLVAAALASRAVSLGHVCVDLATAREQPLLDRDGQRVDLRLPGGFEWVLELARSAVCSDGTKPTPLIYDAAARLYLARYFRYEQRLAAALHQRARSETPTDIEALRATLDRICPLEPSSTNSFSVTPQQRLAALVASLGALSVITGGPGTGKTTIVIRILALLIEQSVALDGTLPRILLLAPTGKAAARLAEAVESGKQHLPSPTDVVAAIPTTAATIHRTLGFQPASPTRFVYNENQRLPADIVVVDEASMIDLALMTKLVSAIRDDARLIMLGDQDQLASVEAGAILGDICSSAGASTYSSVLTDQIARVEGHHPQIDDASANRRPNRRGIWDCIVELRESHRFDPHSPIGRLAYAVRDGRIDDVDRALVQSPGDQQVLMVHVHDAETLTRAVREHVLPHVIRQADGSPQERLARLTEFRLLCAHRRGRFGSETINQIIETMLARQGHIVTDDDTWDGRPIMVVRNDYQLHLYNGDTGVIAYEHGHLKAWFSTQDGALRSYLPARLPPHESVYAMTVHKSQGSEFDRIALLIPQEVSPVLTRELIYTAVTRAKRQVVLIGDAQVLRDATGRRIRRASGLRDALWQDFP